MKLLRNVILLFFIAIPIAAWAFIKPIRVIAPELSGLTCDDVICIDDISRFEEARELYQEALVFVEERIGKIDSPPRAIFCASSACATHFGFKNGSYGHASAYNVATFGLAISPRGWHSYYVRHELIHHLQNERLGSLNAWLFMPAWFKEGMAYSLSDDPREPLPGKLEALRLKYETWTAQFEPHQLWLQAGKL